MNPSSLIPAAQTIPVSWVWFDVLLVLGFWAHILMMNAVFGGGVISLLNSGGKTEPLARGMSKKIPTMLALTINFGVAPLLFLQVNYGQFDYAGTVLMGGWWLAVIPFLLVAYYGFYIWDFRYKSLGSSRNVFLALALGCMLFIGFMFVNNMTLMLVPGEWTAYLKNGGETMLNFGDSTLLPRYLHFMTGALAIGGVAVAIVGRRAGREDQVHVGLMWFARATVINIGFGFWFLVALPQRVMVAFMGGDALATGSLLAALFGAGLIIHAGGRRNLRLSILWGALTVLTMALARHAVRKLMLEPYYSVTDLEVTGQASPLVMFLAALVLGMCVIAWMIRLYLKSGKEA